MKRYSSYLMLLSATVIGSLVLFGDDSIGSMVAMKASVAAQRQRNDVMARHITELHQQVDRIKYDDRYLEKLARNQLALGRRNELVFIFEDTLNSGEFVNSSSEKNLRRQPGLLRSESPPKNFSSSAR